MVEGGRRAEPSSPTGSGHRAPPPTGSASGRRHRPDPVTARRHRPDPPQDGLVIAVPRATALNAPRPVLEDRKRERREREGSVGEKRGRESVVLVDMQWKEMVTGGERLATGEE